MTFLISLCCRKLNVVKKLPQLSRKIEPQLSRKIERSGIL